MIKPYYLIIFFLSLFSCKQQEIYKSISTNVTIDGDAQEWGSNFQYDKVSRFIYSVSNDQDNLYLCIKVENKDLQTKMVMGGLTIYIDTTGKKKQKLAIKYPIGLDDARLTMPSKNKQTLTINELLKENKQHFSELEIKGFDIVKSYGDEFMRIPFSSKMGIAGKMACDSNDVLVYELKIPIKLITTTRVNVDKIWSISLVTDVDKGGSPGNSGSNQSAGLPPESGMGGGLQGQTDTRPMRMNEMGFREQASSLHFKFKLN